MNVANGDEEKDGDHDGYPFSGYYLPYPDAGYEGLVSTISDKALPDDVQVDVAYTLVTFNSWVVQPSKH